MDLPRRVAFRSVIFITLLGTQAWAAAPTIISLSPASGSGQTQTFTLTASDSAGAADIASIDMLINSTFSTAHACWIYYDHAGNRGQLAGDSGGWSGASIGMGQAPGFSNSQCSVEFVSSSDAGNTVSVSFNVTFNSAWPGDKIIWGESLDKAKNDSMYQQMGTWSASSSGPAPDFTVSITPPHQSITRGHTVAYNVALTPVNGFSGTIYVTTSYSPDPGGITVRSPTSYNVISTTDGTAATTNSTVYVDTSSTTAPTGNVTISFTYSDNNLQHTVPVTLTILPATAPAIAISPTSGSGSTQTFNITATDPGGYTAVSGINFLINSTLNGAHACWLYYQPQTTQSGGFAGGILTLASDDGSDWSRSVQIDSAQNSPPSIQNSQCNVFGGPTTVSGDGNTLTLTITLTFTSSFAGSKNLYVRASDQAGPSTDYTQLGTFTAMGGSSGADFSFAIDPTSVTVTGKANRAYAINLTGTNSYNGTVSFTVSGLPPNGSLDAPPPATPGAAPSYFTVYTAGSTPTGAYTITVTGTDGTLTHTATTMLNVTAAPLPTVSASPNTGSGATQTFTFTSTGTASAQPISMNILFNTAVDGRAACWLYFHSPAPVALASDDGSLWTSMSSNSPTVGNSQCTLSGFSLIDNAYYQSGFTVTITFSQAFAGAKNIFVRGDNSQGGDTGYQLVGNWTIP